jgi:hypothetical protein
MTISLLSKYKPQFYFLPLEAEWIEFSYDAPELKLLEKIVSEDENGQVGIKLIKRNGIHPSEDESIKEEHTRYLDSAKEYFNAIKKIAEETGLTPAEITTRTNQTFKELETELLNKSDSSTYIDELAKVRKSLKNENDAIAQLLTDYNEYYNKVQNEYSEAYDNYYIALISKFLSGKRTEEKVNFTIEAVRNLHSGLRNSLAVFVTNEINGWEKEGKPKV